MKISMPRSPGARLAPLFLVTLGASSYAGDAPPSAPEFAAATHEPARLSFDEPGDGRIWARGDHYKASFGPEGARYVASFGAAHPSTAPFLLSPDRVTSGERPVSFEAAAKATRDGDRIHFDRRGFVETYELAVDSMEQLFVFDELPSREDLVLHLPIATDLAGIETDAGLEFHGEFGHVAYSRAVAIDRAGRRAYAATHLEDGAVTIRVDAEFLATATLPLVIDPVLTQFWVVTTDTEMKAPDMSWDPFHQVWAVVHESVFSSTDTDVEVRAFNASGVLQATNSVDLTTSSWVRPRIADNGAAHVFLVVAERTSSSPKFVVGRIVQPNGTILTVHPQIIGFGGSFLGDMFTPDVGGDPSLSGNTNFCVAFVRSFQGGPSDIMMRLVSPTGQFASVDAVPASDPENKDDVQPSVARSNGGHEWLVAWVHQSVATAQDIWCTTVSLAGQPLHGSIAVTSNTSLDTSPCVSSPMAHDQRSVIAFSRRAPNQQADFDVALAVVDYTQPLPTVVPATVIQTVNLTFDSGLGQTPKDQLDPSVDCDGRHFLVTYSEVVPGFLHKAVYAHDLYLADDHLGTSQSHVELHPMLGLEQRASRVAAAAAPVAQALTMGVVYEVRSGANDISAVLFQNVRGGATASICAGTAGACPCGNAGTSGAGCGNSIVAGGGARLIVTGTASTTSDTLRLEASGMPATAPCLFFQGTTVVTPVAFGDGLRCVGGTTIRLAVKAAALGAAVTPAVGSSEPAITAAGLVPIAGGTRTYQTWYRDSAAFCTSATFNLTNGVLVDWAP